jgi:hypothetical protein
MTASADKFFVLLIADDYMTDREDLRRLGGVAKALGGRLYEAAPTYRERTTEITFYYVFDSVAAASSFKGYVRDVVVNYRGISKGPMSQADFDTYMRTR